MKISLQEAADTLRQAQNIVITAHINPDGDAIGSSLGLMHALQSLGKTCRVYLDDDIRDTFRILPGRDVIQRPDKENPQPITGADLLVILDTTSDRIGRIGKLCQAPVLNIDHHVTNDVQAEKTYVDGSRAACAEIVHELVQLLGVPFEGHKDMATCIYTGLATDTGFFSFSNTTAHTMRAAADMLAAGVVPNVISEALEKRPFEDVQSLAKALGYIEIWHEGRAVGVFLDHTRMAELTHTEGLIDNIRVIEGADIAVVMKEKEVKKIRVSMRSTGLDVAAIGKKFGGGGHVRAAGCGFREIPFAEARRRLLAAIDAALDAYKPAKV